MNLGLIELLIMLAGVFLLIFALIVVALVVFLVQRRKSALTGRQPCPYCAELINTEARVCRYCGRDLPASAAGSVNA